MKTKIYMWVWKQQIGPLPTMSDSHLLIYWSRISYNVLKNLNAHLRATWFLPWNQCCCKVFSSIRGRQTSCATDSLEGLLKHRSLELTPRVSDSFLFGKGLEHVLVKHITRECWWCCSRDHTLRTTVLTTFSSCLLLIWFRTRANSGNWCLLQRKKSNKWPLVCL